MKEQANRAEIRTVCPLHPGYNCGLSAHVEKGVIKKFVPASFPEPRLEGACAKGLLAHHWIYHPDRLRHPLKRVGERGNGKWERISWGEAIDAIATKLAEVVEKHGPKSIAWSVADVPLLRSAGYSRLVGLTKGTLVHNLGSGDLSGPTADIVTFGRLLGALWALVFEKPELAIVWGSNPADTDHQMMGRILEARKRGCSVVVIDPRRSATAAQADEHIPLRPGTDGALALGMIHVVLEEGLEDVRFIMEKTVGPLLVRTDNGRFLRERDVAGSGGTMVWDENSGQAQPAGIPGLKPALRGRYFLGTECRPAYDLLTDMVKEYSPEKVSCITDVSAEIIRRLASRYATQKPASIYRGWGMQRSFHADLSCRAINTLAAVTGNVNLLRPLTYEDIVRPDAGDFAFPTAGAKLNTIPIMNLYDAITRGEPFPVKAFCNAGHNFINQLPNARKIIRELLPSLEFILVCDHFLGRTAKYADYVLPASTGFECLDLTFSFDGKIPYMQLQQKVIEPLYDCKSDFQIAAELARRMGFGSYFNKSEEHYIKEILAEHPAIQGVTLEQLKQGPVRQMPPVGAPLRTATGRIEFYAERLTTKQQELSIYLEPVESTLQERAKKYPLSLLTPHHKYRVHSTLANVRELLRFDPELTLDMHPVDAESRGLHDGDVVCVFNDRGKVKVKLKLTMDMKPSVVSLYQGWWPEHYIEGHHNDLTHDLINPVQKAILGPNAALYDVLVEVCRAE